MNSYEIGEKLMSAEFLQEFSKDEWNSFVDISPQGSIFCYYEWLEFSTDKDFRILIYKENGKIVAGMPLPFFSRRRIRLPKLTQKMGVLFEDFSNLKCASRLEKEKKIIYEFVDILKQEKKSYNMAFDWHFYNWLPFYWKGFEQTTWYTYVIDFTSKDLDSIWQDMDERTRNSIRKAQKIPLSVYETSDLSRLYEFDKITFDRQKRRMPYSFGYIEKLYVIFKDNIRMLEAVDDNGTVQAISFYISDKKSVYYLMSGADPNYKNSGAQNLIQWEAIKYYYDKVRYFDFEGSILENIEANFRKFGAEQKPYFYICDRTIFNKLLDIARIILKR